MKKYIILGIIFGCKCFGDVSARSPISFQLAIVSNYLQKLLQTVERVPNSQQNLPPVGAPPPPPPPPSNWTPSKPEASAPIPSGNEPQPGPKKQSQTAQKLELLEAIRGGLALKKTEASKKTEIKEGGLQALIKRDTTPDKESSDEHNDSEWREKQKTAAELINERISFEWNTFGNILCANKTQCPSDLKQFRNMVDVSITRLKTIESDMRGNKDIQASDQAKFIGSITDLLSKLAVISRQIRERNQNDDHQQYLEYLEDYIKNLKDATESLDINGPLLRELKGIIDKLQEDFYKKSMLKGKDFESFILRLNTLRTHLHLPVTYITGRLDQFTPQSSTYAEYDSYMSYLENWRKVFETRLTQDAEKKLLELGAEKAKLEAAVGGKMAPIGPERERQNMQKRMLEEFNKKYPQLDLSSVLKVIKSDTLTSLPSYQKEDLTNKISLFNKSVTENKSLSEEQKRNLKLRINEMSNYFGIAVSKPPLPPKPVTKDKKIYPQKFSLSLPSDNLIKQLNGLNSASLDQLTPQQIIKIFQTLTDEDEIAQLTLESKKQINILLRSYKKEIENIENLSPIERASLPKLKPFETDEW